MPRGVYPRVRSWAKPLKERFDAKWVRYANGCWIWQAKGVKAGYGRIWVGAPNRRALAHVVSYTLYVGEIPAGLELDHLCNDRRCVNPEHLEPVTHQENIRRLVARRKARRG